MKVASLAGNIDAQQRELDGLLESFFIPDPPFSLNWKEGSRLQKSQGQLRPKIVSRSDSLWVVTTSLP
ncbi:hypothetical protein [Mesorhizobium sp. WSM2561]|uniref:hypothetical protein n=1 Tax=Mesorhizobium sp. WSM2561 TaxID=1040985 RepID=UPI0012EBCD14|nr:hypothetical protein [Mesorhizobium sp. WSM2561]